MKGLEFRPKLFTMMKTYTKADFMTDLMAGIIVGIVALPLAIAFGIASGVSPEKGIITAIVAGFIISFLGGSKVQIGGPTGAFIVIIYGIIQEYGIDGLMVATMMAGVLLILLGIFKLGTVIKFIPYPIIIGFTSGIAVTIFTTQIADIFGLDFKGEKVPGDFIGKWILYFHHFDTVNWWNVIVSVVSVFIIAITPKFSKKVPGSLVAIILVTVGVYCLKLYGGITCIDTIGDRFSIKAQLPEAAVPALDWEAIKNLFPVAITIAVLGAIESLLSAAVADGVIGDRHDSNTELIAQGIANFVSPTFGGIPATGAIARTMTNINNGGKSPVAGIVHAVVLLLILLFLMPLAQYIPMACLAGVLVIVSYNMSGFSFVGMEDMDNVINMPVRLVFADFNQNYSLMGIIVRKVVIGENKIVYGCRLGVRNANLEQYISQKQRQMLSMNHGNSAFQNKEILEKALKEPGRADRTAQEQEPDDKNYKKMIP